jgi:hypothetical protein
MEHDVVVEWAPFELVEGADEAQLLQASAALQADFLSKQTGFIRRELLKGSDNRWVDLVYWRDDESVRRAMQAVTDSAACQRYFQLMASAEHNDAAAGVSLFRQRQRYD